MTIEEQAKAAALAGFEEAWGSPFDPEDEGDRHALRQLEEQELEWLRRKEREARDV